MSRGIEETTKGVCPNSWTADHEWINGYHSLVHAFVIILENTCSRVGIYKLFL